MAEGEDGGDVFDIGRVEGVVGGGAEEGQVEREFTGFGEQGCFALGGLVLDYAYDVSYLCNVPHSGRLLFLLLPHVGEIINIPKLSD